VVQREIGQNVYFNPLHALEFRPEFDRITNRQMLELMRAVPDEQARRLVALAVLSLFRMLRYLSLAEASARQATETPKRSTATVYVVLSVLRSDARALASHFRQRAGQLLADGFDADIFQISAPELPAQYERLLARGHGLRDIKAALEAVAANLRLEMRRAFERDFPALDVMPPPDELRSAIQRLIANLRPAFQNAVIFMGTSLGTRLDAGGVFDEEAARRALSERLRRDVWMFGQIVRAFAVKARSVDGSRGDGWGAESPVAFVREFLAYFRAMGYPLLRAADYPRVDAFLGAIAKLEDVPQPSRLAAAVDEAEQFYVFLSELFDAIGRREELAGVDFDRHAAAGSLKLYLGE
jgi:hypothetical protein